MGFKSGTGRREKDRNAHDAKNETKDCGRSTGHQPLPTLCDSCSREDLPSRNARRSANPERERLWAQQTDGRFPESRHSSAAARHSRHTPWLIVSFVVSSPVDCRGRAARTHPRIASAVGVLGVVYLQPLVTTAATFAVNTMPVPNLRCAEIFGWIFSFFAHGVEDYAAEAESLKGIIFMERGGRMKRFHGTRQAKGAGTLRHPPPESFDHEHDPHSAVASQQSGFHGSRDQATGSSSSGKLFLAVCFTRSRMSR